MKKLTDKDILVAISKHMQEISILLGQLSDKTYEEVSELPQYFQLPDFKELSGYVKEMQ